MILGFCEETMQLIDDGKPTPPPVVPTEKAKVLVINARPIAGRGDGVNVLEAVRSHTGEIERTQTYNPSLPLISFK